MACHNSCAGQPSCLCCVFVNCCPGTKMPRTLTWQKISHFTGLPIDSATLTWNGDQCQWFGVSILGKNVCFGCTLAPNEVWVIDDTALTVDGCCTLAECSLANQTIANCNLPLFKWDPCGGAGNFETISA